jgi:hypothetical protein
VSAHLWTEAQIQCDHPDCVMSEFAGSHNLQDTTARTLRQALRQSGWAVNVRDSGRLLDYCPKHAPAISVPGTEDSTEGDRD